MLTKFFSLAAVLTTLALASCSKEDSVSPGPKTANEGAAVEVTIANGVYKLTARHSGKSLGTGGGEIFRLGPVVQSEYSGPRQQWRIESTGGDSYKLICVYSGGYLTADGTASGALLSNSAGTDSGDQRWRIEPTSDGYYKLINELSGLAMDVPAASTDSGVRLLQWEDNGGANQQWQVETVSTTPPNPNPAAIANGVYNLTARHSGKSLEVPGGAIRSLIQVSQGDYSGALHQQWRVESTGDGYYTLAAVHSGKYLTAVGTASGLPVMHSEGARGTDQRWKIEPTSDGYYKLVSKLSGQAVDVPSASTDSGVRLVQWEDNGGTNQQWQFNLL